MDNPLVQPDPGLFIWTIVTFLVLLWALRKYAWGPLLQALDARQETIRKSLDEAEQARQALAQAQQQSQKVLAEARAEAQSILARTRSAAEAFQEESRRKAKTEAEAQVAAAKRQIRQETARAMQEIRRETVDLSLQIASKLIRKNLTAEDNDVLIRESLGQITSATLRSRWEFRWRETPTAQAPGPEQTSGVRGDPGAPPGGSPRREGARATAAAPNRRARSRQDDSSGFQLVRHRALVP